MYPAVSYYAPAKACPQDDNCARPGAGKRPQPGLRQGPTLPVVFYRNRHRNILCNQIANAESPKVYICARALKYTRVWVYVTRHADRHTLDVWLIQLDNFRDSIYELFG